MRAKLIILFVIIKVLPLIILAFIAWSQAYKLASDVGDRALDLHSTAYSALIDSGQIATTNAVKALDERAREDIERITTDAAKHVADFLYKCDNDILFAAQLPVDKTYYANFVKSKVGRLTKPSEWVLAPDGKGWVPVKKIKNSEIITSSNPENNLAFHYRPADTLDHELRPLFLEISFIDLNGQEKIKITSTGTMEQKLQDVSKRANTYIKAETYFAELKKLKPGEIYVSDVIGAYVGSKIIGTYTPENAQKKGISYDPENSAYAGKENPVGKRFKGLIRWATPVEKEGKVVGYVTLALDHDHIMEFTDHISPTNERYTDLPDASEGNYAFIWDYKGRSIVHPRHFSIVGYDPETGDPQVPWLEDKIYDEWQASGKSYEIGRAHV